MGAELIFAGDLNGDLRRMGGVAMVTVGLQYISAHYLPRWRAWNLFQTPCDVVKQGRLMRSLTAYIMCSDRLVLHNMSAWSWCVWVFASPSDQFYYLITHECDMLFGSLSSLDIQTPAFVFFPFGGWQGESGPLGGLPTRKTITATTLTNRTTTMTMMTIVGQ